MSACRMCQSERLHQFLDLGFTPPADEFLTEAQLNEPQNYYPLKVLTCRECGLVQLSYLVSPEILYQKDYPYESSTTRAGREHWFEFAETLCDSMDLGPEDLVIDFGSNVGVLLEMFGRRGVRTLGIDPAANIVDIANRRGMETICGFFNTDTAREGVSRKGYAKVITATNVFAHIDDLNEVMRAVDKCLDQNGIFVIEAPYLVNLILQLEYDTIYHEHLSYLSVRPLVSFFERFGMCIFDIQERDIHGGSFRVFARRNGAEGPPAGAVERFLRLEEEKKIHDTEALESFARNVENNRRELQTLLWRLKSQGNSIVGVSAPAKGMTLLNYCHIGPEILDFVTEKSELKIGKYTPGMHIRVLPDDALLEHQPDYALLLAWNFAEEIMNNLSRYRRAGGKFIIPIPSPRIVE